MSEKFNKNCYTSRSSGYKYRTLSTNTGDRKRRNSKEDTVFGTKFNDLRREISTRIFNELEETQRARESILEKFSKIDCKIDSLLELHNTVNSLRDDLHNAENSLADIIEKVDNLEVATAGNDAYILRSRKSSMRAPPPIFEE